jgi:homoserine kinase
MASPVRVTVPATTANLGPGFDCLGAALTLHNQFIWTSLSANSSASATSPALPAFTVEVTGTEADRVDRTADNLAYQSFLKVYQTIGQSPPPVHLAIDLQVPLARGLGSSATAIVGGLMGANAMAGSPLSLTEIQDLAIATEGHPDNVVPALKGGCRLAAMDRGGQWAIAEIPWHESVTPILAIPNFELSTAEARRVLPSTYSRADAVFNIAHLGLLLRGLETGNPDWLKAALQDRIHQPYRQALIQGYAAVEARAIAADAYGLVISGAGPTLLALAPREKAEGVAEAMRQGWADESVAAEVKILQVDLGGAGLDF